MLSCDTLANIPHPLGCQVFCEWLLTGDMLFADNAAVATHTQANAEEDQRSGTLCTEAPPAIAIKDYELYTCNQFIVTAPSPGGRARQEERGDWKSRASHRVCGPTTICQRSREIAVYNTSIISTLLHVGETWKTYARTERRLNTFQISLGASLEYYQSTIETLRKLNIFKQSHSTLCLVSK